MPSGVAAAVIMNTHSTPKENTAEYVVHNDKERDEFENSHSEKQRRVAIYERVLADVNRVVDKQAATRSNYLSLCIWLLYFILYAAVLVMQRDPVAAFEVEQTLKDVILTPNSGIVDSATGETVPRFASAADVYQFFQSTMNTLYQDPKCGNGVCENGESKAFADQGCSVDCGAWTQVSTYNISLWSNNPEDDLRYWGLCEKNTHYCLKASQVIRPGDNQTHTVQLFDGEWTLRVEPSMDGIGGKIAKVVVDVAATNAFNATVWQANANKNLIKYRTNPKYFYKSEIVTSWASCNEDTTGVPTGVTSCNSNDEAEYCDDNYLGDGVCDSDCNVLVCAFDKGDCCRPVPGRTAITNMILAKIIANHITISIRINIGLPELEASSCTNAFGMYAIIPTMINNEIPLPIPLSVIFSPNHIAKIVPVTRMITEGIMKSNPFPIVNASGGTPSCPNPHK